MKDKDARSRIENLFVSYKLLLWMHGILWNIAEDEKKLRPKCTVCHLPESLQSRLESDLELSDYKLIKKYKEFTQHAVKLSGAF